MVKLTKIDEPGILTANKDKWAKEYLALTDDHQPIPEAISNRYRHPEIKRVVVMETHEKCAYCESKIRHDQYGDIEHILPRTARPELIYEWANLTLACSRCNSGKRDYYNVGNPLINPYEDEPNAHFIFLGPYILEIPADSRADITIHLLGLNRKELLERRLQKVNEANLLAELYCRENDPKRRNILLEQLWDIGNDNSEYSAVVITFLNELIRRGIIIQRNRN